MNTDTLQNPRADVVSQFSVFTPNRLGRIHDLVGLLAAHQVHVLALTVLDTTDSAIIRIVVDDPEKADQLLATHGFPHSKSRIVVVEVDSPDALVRLMAALLEAELNVHYLYSFIPHPRGKSIIGLSMEDSELAEEALKRHQFVVLRQSDLSR